MVLAIAIPIMVQNGITNFVNMLDNVMVGKLTLEEMSGVTIVNQFVFVFNLLIFGAISSAGIFTAQFHGLGDTVGKRNTFRFKIIIVTLAAAVCWLLFSVLDEELISLFLHESEQQGDLALTLKYGKEYLAVIVWGFIPFALSQSYGSTLRETGKTVVPMVASIVAVLINLAFNYVLIFGHFGAPEMGVKGAAVATVMSRFVELGVVAVWTHVNKKKADFIVGAYRSLKIPHGLVNSIVVRGLPLMANELLWAAGVTFTNQCYSLRGIGVVAALNISSTISNVFNVIYMALGVSISIVVGNLLGAGKLEEAKDTDKKMIAFSLMCSVAVGAILVMLAPIFPQMYNASPEAKEIAVYMIMVTSMIMPAHAFANASYFTLRSGGKTGITFLFDCGFTWVLLVPMALLLSRYTNISILPLYTLCQCVEVIKSITGYFMVRSGIWIQNLAK
jgi:putative MATE family efflux protein